MILGLFIEAKGIDSDGDGMSDVWQRKHAIPVGTGAADPDSDKMTNTQEAAFGTNPNQATHLPSAEISGQAVVIRWKGEPGVRYQLELNDVLVEPNWQPYGPPVLGLGGELLIQLITPFAQEVPVYARLAVLKSDDKDGDGLDAMEESILGSSDVSRDSDGDRITDAEEFNQRLNPISSADGDGDGMPDDWELYKIGSTNLNAFDDPDTDGFNLVEEFSYDLDPTKDDFSGTGGFTTHQFTYDAAGQLIEVAGTLAERFAYDREGNLGLRERVWVKKTGKRLKHQAGSLFSAIDGASENGMISR